MILSLGSRWCGRRRRSSEKAGWHNDPHVTCLKASWTEVCARDAWSWRCPLVGGYVFEKRPQSQGAREADGYPGWSSTGRPWSARSHQKRRHVPLMGKAKRWEAEQREDELFQRGSQVCCVHIQLMFHCMGSRPTLQKMCRYIENVN